MLVSMAAKGTKDKYDHDQKAKERQFEVECIRCVMNRSNVERWYKNLCLDLDDLKRVRVDKRAKKTNVTYDAIWKLHENIQTFDKLCDRLQSANSLTVSV